MFVDGLVGESGHYFLGKVRMACSLALRAGLEVNHRVGHAGLLIGAIALRT